MRCSGIKRAAALLVIGWGLLDDSRSFAETPPTHGPLAVEPAQSPESSNGADAMDEVNTQDVKITAAEAASHKLPAVEIQLNLGETGLSGHKFPAEGDYLKLSGPPGGPLGLRILHVAKSPTNKAQWQKLIEERLEIKSPELGSLSEIKLAGAKHPAFTFTTGQGQARAHHLLVLIAIPKSEESLLLDFHRGGRTGETPSPEELAKDEKFAELSPSLSIRFE